MLAAAITIAVIIIAIHIITQQKCWVGRPERAGRLRSCALVLKSIVVSRGTFEGPGV